MKSLIVNPKWEEMNKKQRIEKHNAKKCKKHNMKSTKHKKGCINV
jgi:hypothetical protein